MNIYEAWQRECHELNHDWLKNTYIPALAKWQNILDDKVEDSYFTQTFLTYIFPSWELHRDKAFDLLANYHKSMTPKNLFSEPPLSYIDGDTKEWLGNLVHYLWLARMSVGEIIDGMSLLVKCIDQSYSEIKKALNNLYDIENIIEHKKLKQLFVEMLLQLRSLFNAFDKLRGEVKVC